MDSDTVPSTNNILLKGRSDWPYWFAQLELHARDKAVWDQINPDAKTVQPIDEQEPDYPELPEQPTQHDFQDNANEDDQADELDNEPTNPPTNKTYEQALKDYERTLKNHPENVQRYKVATAKWTRTAAKLSNIRDWINKTVSPDLMAPASIKLLNTRESTPQALIRVLKNDLAPTDSNTMNLVRQQYRAHLEKARSGRMSPDKWFNEWQVLYGKAQAFRVSEVEGQLALTDFLDALAPRIAPEWARSMRQHIVMEAALGRPDMRMDDLARIFTMTLQEQAISNVKGKGSSVFATFGGSPETSRNNKGRSEFSNRKDCPCRINGTHTWEPIRCRRLQTAITGTAPSGSPKIALSDLDKTKIKERFEKPEWTKLRDQVKDKGWGNSKQSSDTQSTTKYPGAISAAVIDPSQFMPDTQGVYSTTYNGHPLAMSTILDGGGAVHLVNDRNLLVPGTFKPASRMDTVDAGTQSLPVSGSGDRLLRSVLHGNTGPRSEDLLLKDVKVVEGFHVNIVSEARLKKAGIWYLGLDQTLRYGSIKNNVIMATLHSAHNLAFIEYKKVDYYSHSLPTVNALASSSTPKTRTDNEELWHKRSGHLGKRALQALVRSAQNVQIEGITRLECEHCATTHATQVISRRPRERSPRPFYRISWDLFDMPTGRLNEEWSMILKEDYSGKLFNHNLHAKSLEEIMAVLDKFENWVWRKYNLRIVEIHQDNDTATRPWRGRSRYDEWAEERGIKIITPAPYTHEPNGSAERAGKELITKSIKMRVGANLPAKLWPEIMDAAAFLHAMSPSAIHEFRSPNEVLDTWFKMYFRWYQPAQIRHRTADLRPDWSGIYAYGCRAYPLDRDRAAGRDKRGFKVHPRGHIGYLVGYKASNIYLIWVPTLDQVIVTRNVTFNESLFYQEKKEEEMPKEQAIKLVEVLHDGELNDPGQDVQIPDLEEHNVLAQRNQSATDQNDGGDLLQSSDTGAGLPHGHEMEQAETARDDSQASNHPEIRAGRLEITGLVTPELTPDPVNRGADGKGVDDQHDRMGTDGQQGVHSPVRAGSSCSSDRTGSQELRQERPTNLASRSSRAASAILGEARDNPPQRTSRRLRGEVPEINRSTSVYKPIRRRRNRGDQLGGGTSRSVNALIADLSEENDLWSDFKNTYLPGIQQAWDDRSSYKTMNAMVMSATTSDQQDHKSQQKIPAHRDDLPPPPKTWKQLLQHPLKSLFINASEKEIDQLKKKGTWTEIATSEVSDRPLPLKWVWTYKFDQDGYFIKCKARIVVRGDLQEVNTLQSTYAATLAARSFRTAMAIAAQFDLEIMQYDVVGAFLNALITSSNPVICDMPDGFKRHGYSVKLNRALYGLKESPLLWYEEFSSSLKAIGLQASKEEPCLFFDQKRRILVLFYVDDILLLYHKSYEQEATQLWSKIMDKYEIQDQGPVQWFLGVRVVRNREAQTVTLLHDTYIDRITKKFGLEDGTYPKTPLPSEDLIKNNGEASKQEIKSYQEKVGSVLYTAIMLRPDIAFAVSKLSHYLTNPSDQHFKAVDRVIMYLFRTRREGIHYGNYNGPDLTICGDASFADDPETRRSSHGYIAILFGGPILWKAARQNTVTTSTTEAELLALEHVSKETIAIKRFFDELTLDMGEIWNIWCDNQQTIRLIVGSNERINTKLRHVDIQNMWLRQEYAKGSLQISYLETGGMPADGLTKTLTQQQFDKFKLLINLQGTDTTITEQDMSTNN